MSKNASIPTMVAVGAVAWGLVLLVAWAVQPIGAVAEFASVENPTPAQLTSIDRAFADDPEADLIRRFDCGRSPLDVATGDSGRAAAPELDPGFEYTSVPCSNEYNSARAAFWVNVFAIVAIVSASVALRFRLGENSDESDPDSTVAVGVEHPSTTR